MRYEGGAGPLSTTRRRGEGGGSARSDRIPPDVVLAFAPLHKRAFGMAVGLTAGALVFLATVLSVVRPGYPDFVPLWSNYFYGYRVSWWGACIGFAWAFLAFFVAGWFTAFLRNLIIAVSFRVGYLRDELERTRDFLDHI